MHGMIGRALECFLADGHGAEARRAALAHAGLSPDGFRSTRHYEPSAVPAVLRAASADLGLPPRTLLSDLGVWLVSQPGNEAIRRLVRFGGADFRGFLHSLEDLPARGRLALPDLDLPRIALLDRNPVYEVRIDFGECGAGWVVSGVLRGMADDYGVLALVEHRGLRRRVDGTCVERVRVEVADDAHAAGRDFDLSPSLEQAA